MKFPPCKHCKHSKSKHGLGERFTYVGWHKRRQITKVPECRDCYNFVLFGPTYEWEYDIDAEKVEWPHEYEGDNLALLELKSRRHELLKEVSI